MKKTDINQMTLREKIAQTCLVRQSDLLMRADKAYDELRDPAEAKEIMTKNQFGGIWVHGNTDVNSMSKKYNDYFAFDSRKYLNWFKDVISEVEIPVLGANDPGGKSSIDDLSRYATGLIIGAADSEELAYELGQCVGLEHKAYGCNWLWCPNVDLMGRFTGDIVRPFSNIQEQQIRMCRAYFQGIQDAGVAACAKHFPGPDPNETRDGHVVTTYNKQSKEDWKQGMGAVFQAMIDAGVDTIMDAGSAFPAVDDTKIGKRYAACGLSQKVLQDLLRGEMGFDGVIITDDVNMGGFTSYYEKDEIYGRFLAAGNDVLLGVGIDAVDRIEDCVRRGIVTEERITDACRRVLALKEKLGMFEDGFEYGGVDLDAVKARTAAVIKKIAEKGLTLVRDEINLLPLKEKPKHVTIFVYTHAEGIMTRLQAMKQAFEARGAEVVLKRRPESYTEIEEAAERSDLIIYAGYIGHFAPKGGPSFYGEEFWCLRYTFTAGREKSMGVSLGYPFIHYFFMDDADTFVNLYTPDERVQEAFVAAVYGEIPFSGIAPLDMTVR